MRAMLRSRCSRENVSSLERCVRTTSPSSTVTSRPSASSWATSASAIVDLPAPDRPVRKTVTPLLDMAASVPKRPLWSAGRALVAERAPGALQPDQLGHVVRQLPGHDVGEGYFLEHAALGLPGGHPHAGEGRGV